MGVMIKLLTFVGNLFKDLLTDKNLHSLQDSISLSLGRISFVVMYIMSLIMWSTGKDIPEGMLIVLLSLLTYILGSKSVSTVLSNFKSKKTSKLQIVDPEEAGD